ncbi:MAG: mannonate dehydratase [Bifidobacteriaceae bacterium]|jgi:mannonate dehydratase|nr:mannonate dehydratase [Bifidobacteriaceae bacterium]
MKMAFRWFGEGNDTVSLSEIRQIPGVETIVWSLHHKIAGEVWEKAEIDAAIAEIRQVPPGLSKALDAEVVESVNVHESIKLGKTIQNLPRDLAIENYITTIERLGQAGVKVICYNFMPVFDWLRTEMFHPLPDGSTAMAYNAKVVQEMSQTGPERMIESMIKNSGGFTLPGWEPERLQNFQELVEAYRGVTHEDMYVNYKYFLDAVIPTCEKYDVKLGVHPDDPPFDIFGWPRVVSTKEGLARVLSLNPSPYNGLTLCLGSFSANPHNQPVDAVASFIDRIVFSHVRNIKHYDDWSFTEVGHRACEGDVDTVGIMKVFAEHNYSGYIRPDHGRQLWDENTTRKPRPGYGLYDRALGIEYLLGLWDAFHCPNQ